jgi:hypothetical protein
MHTDEMEISESEENPTNLIDDIPSINQFLTKGIIIKTSKDKTFIFKKNLKPGKGYLGLDIEQLRDFIKMKFPEILLD